MATRVLVALILSTATRYIHPLQHPSGRDRRPAVGDLALGKSALAALGAALGATFARRLRHRLFFKTSARSRFCDLRDLPTSQCLLRVSVSAGCPRRKISPPGPLLDIRWGTERLMPRSCHCSTCAPKKSPCRHMPQRRCGRVLCTLHRRCAMQQNEASLPEDVEAS